VPHIKESIIGVFQRMAKNLGVDNTEAVGK